ncbi:hypothetical protein [uncultured Veillonella sp.]|uniref:hypothetical protein n=1 Tax=uncultured Veillonella sp. TaxID=159268 RepID=UPI00260E403E|nr:hypothetical protein [uncultured Veillonella sp.]
MNEQMKAVLDSTKIKFELCEMGRDYIDKYNNNLLDIYELVALVTLKAFERGVFEMTEIKEH